MSIARFQVAVPCSDTTPHASPLIEMARKSGANIRVQPERAIGASWPSLMLTRFVSRSGDDATEGDGCGVEV